MALDLAKLEDDAYETNKRASAALVAIREFRRGKVAGQNYTAGQKAALRNRFDSDIRDAQAVINSIVAQLDVN